MSLILTAKENKLFNKNGVIDEKAVLAYREYMDTYSDMERDHAREKAAGRYFPKNEKSTVTSCTLEDDYEE